jgi:hypothetical protein
VDEDRIEIASGRDFLHRLKDGARSTGVQKPGEMLPPDSEIITVIVPIMAMANPVFWGGWKADDHGAPPIPARSTIVAAVAMETPNRTATSRATSCRNSWYSTHGFEELSPRYEFLLHASACFGTSPM